MLVVVLISRLVVFWVVVWIRCGLVNRCVFGCLIIVIRLRKWCGVGRFGSMIL